MRFKRYQRGIAAVTLVAASVVPAAVASTSAGAADTAVLAPSGVVSARGARSLSALPANAPTPAAPRGVVINRSPIAAQVALQKEAAARAPQGSKSGSPNAPVPLATTTKKAAAFGLSQCDEGAGCWNPPDSGAMAVGGSNIVQATNSAIRFYAKPATGATTLTKQYGATLNAFFGATYAGAGALFDPRAVYDPTWKRYVVISDSFADTSGVQYLWVAISKNSNPVTGGWWIYALNTSFIGANNFYDFPMLGFSQDAVTVTANVFVNNGGYVTTDEFAVAKARLYNGLGFSTPVFAGLGGTTATPIVLDQNTNFFLLTQLSSTSFRKWTVANGAYPGFTSLASATVPIASYSSPASAAQGGSSIKLDTGDGRVSSQTVQNGNSLWAVHAVACFTTFSCPRFYEINTATNAVSQTGTPFFDGASTDYNPSIAASATNTVAVSWAASDASRTPFTVLATRKSADAAGTLGNKVNMLGSTGPITCSGSPTARFGDYSQTALDPGSTTKFWVENELGLASCAWTTSVGFGTAS